MLTFTQIATPSSLAVFGEEAAAMTGNAIITGNVVNLLSFEWRLIGTDAGGAFAYLQTLTAGGGTTNTFLAGPGSPEFGTVTLYQFATPYTGTIVIGMGSGDVRLPAVLEVDKFTTQATATVPEPETYAMLFAGLGMLGFLSRRKIGNKRPANTGRARFQMPRAA